MLTNDLITLRPGLQAHSSGALWLPGCRTAIVADLHLGYAWAQLRRGQLGPLTDGGAAALLRAAVDDLEPSHLVLLGDIVHAPGPMPGEYEVIVQTLELVRAKRKLTCVLGNHDRNFATDFGSLDLDIQTSWRKDDLLAVHGDTLPSEPEPGVLQIVGHFHPVMRLPDASQLTRKLRTFLYVPGLCMLPAFSPFAGGCNFRTEVPAELHPYLENQSIRLIVTSGRRLLPLPPHTMMGCGLRPE